METTWSVSGSTRVFHDRRFPVFLRYSEDEYINILKKKDDAHVVDTVNSDNSGIKVDRSVKGGDSKPINTENTVMAKTMVETLIAELPRGD